MPSQLVKVGTSQVVVGTACVVIGGAIDQITLNVVRVTFTSEPRRFNANAAGDALNPDSYTVTQTFGAGFPLIQVVTTGPGNAVDIAFDRPIPEGTVVTIQTSGIENADQTATLGDFSGTFVAFGAERLAAQTGITVERFDIANPQTEFDAAGQPLGTFSFTESGDLANDSGRRNLRKRIFRRLSTREAGFFHLQDYGLRLDEKRLVTPTLLRELQSQIEEQVRSERNVIGVTATLRELVPGVIGVGLRVEDNLGAFNFDLTIGPDGEVDPTDPPT